MTQHGAKLAKVSGSKGWDIFNLSNTPRSVNVCLHIAGALVAGPRMGRFGPDGKPRPMPGHNCVLYLTGALLLWFGKPCPSSRARPRC